jgi:hypothetical protein
VREGELDPAECAPPRAVRAPGRERGRLVRRVRQNVRSEAGAAAPSANAARRAIVTCAQCTQHLPLIFDAPCSVSAKKLKDFVPVL